jgi:phosphatidylserine/phosphatidylglycerophosphate/cardiolipin synthase-like enzyme
MTTTTEVYLPCDVGRVRVKLGFGDTLSPLEETALRVIAALSPAAGANPERPDPPSEPIVPRAEIGMVAALLGLGYRLVLDLVHDLWRAGYLVVDYSTNTIGLTQDVRDTLASGQLARLRGAESEDCTADLMVERLTGYVMPSDGPGAPADPRLAIRFLANDTGLTDASHADIEQAVRRWLAGKRQGRDRRILSIRSAPEDRAAGAARRWYQLAVQVGINPDTDGLTISVIDHRFPAERRERAGDRLTRLAQERPLETWVIQLRSAAEQRLVTPPPVEEVISRLATSIARGTTLPAGTRRAEHLEWAAESRRIVGLIDDRIAREAEVEPVIGGEAHTAAVSRLIGEARTQIVLVSPRIVDYVLERFRPGLLGAIDRGVQVVILWGGEYKGKLAENVRNALDSLSRRAKTAPVLRAQVSANTAARMVICDNRTALVTSRDLFSTTRERLDIGLLLRSPDGQDNALLSDLLGWTRVNMPGALSTSVLRQATRFTAADSADRDGRTRPRQGLPEALPEDAAETGAVQAWLMGWEAHLAGLRAELSSRPLPSVRIVEDGAHRELLWQALRKAERRVVIMSGQISDEVISSRLIDAITMLLVRGVAVTIGYDEHGGAERGKGALAALTDLAETHPTLLTVHGRGGHAKALVWDDEVTVGSYSYLFHVGYGTVGGRNMLPSELSVRLTDPALADEIAAACGEPPDITARVRSQGSGAARPVPEVDQDALAVAQRILNRAVSSRPGELIRAELRSVANPWPVLGILDRLGDPAIRRTAIAYCLAQGAPDAGTGAHWRDRLVTELVSAGLFTEARILRTGSADGVNGQGEVADVGPRAPRTTILAALSRDGGSGDDALLTAAFESDLSADERAALRAMCIRELLMSDSSDARDALEILPGDDGGWGELASLAMAYYRRAVGAPTAQLMREVSRQRQAGVWLDAAWDRLELALIEAEPIPKTLDGAKKTKAALYNDNGVLGRLRAMAARRDTAALRALVEDKFPARHLAAQVAGDLLDQTWREVAPLSDLLLGRPRIKYVKRLAAVVSAARDLATAGESADLTAESRSAAELLAAASELADGYQRLRPLLELTGDAGPLAAAVITDTIPRLDRLMAGLSAEPEIPDADSVPDGDAGAVDAGLDEGSDRDGLSLWPGKWQYPGLAVALWAAEPDPARIRALLLRDLVDPLSPTQTARPDRRR